MTPYRAHKQLSISAKCVARLHAFELAQGPRVVDGERKFDVVRRVRMEDLELPPISSSVRTGGLWRQNASELMRICHRLDYPRTAEAPDSRQSYD